MTEEQRKHYEIISWAMRTKWAESMMRSCPHPGIKKVYGTDRVCVYVCQMCQHKKTFKWHGGIACNYGKDENV